ncbi:putative transcription factor her-8a [Roseibium sp. TrichSKD4]|uniref:hypothetical protein n=1 Tax=Roseibium sp. TrichSKD4 TaxID=744980 RepID=UPI0001E56F87|nr:hypothetical protein [Roseibium sp. TrichSKD4]EFO32240.1 putative transcription factor her-8a [Roseibium sp. TrichSKD4]
MGDVWMKAGNEIVRSARRFVPIALLATAGCLSAPIANAQTAPETVRINVDPPSPGIRSVLIDKKYRPIINRDKDGVIIDTLGSSDKLPPCDVKLEVTLENSRVLHRNAHLCSGDTLTVDVELDGKPGQARVIRGTGGVVSGSQTPDTPTTQAETSSTPSSQQSETSALTPVTPDQENSTLKPLERAETPIDAPGPLIKPGCLHWILPRPASPSHPVSCPQPHLTRGLGMPQPVQGQDLRPNFFIQAPAQTT